MSINVVVKKSKIHKRGVFAARDFKKGGIVLKWRPKIINKSEAEKLSAGQRRYLCQAGKNEYFLMRSPEKFVNHSCEPSTKNAGRCDIALKNIRKGEEITADYGGEKSDLSVPFNCKCGSKRCNNKIV